jgi:arginyl-tRNA synthetase
MIETHLAGLIGQAIANAQQSGALPAFDVPECPIETPKNVDHGDFATNVAMALAKPAAMSPRKIAEAIIAAFPADPMVAAVEIAGPGFINFRLSPLWLQGAVRDALAQKSAFGAARGAGEPAIKGRINLEFVSANPVGPLHIGNARGGPYGATIANLLEAVGYEVCREYYVNDGPDNTQLNLFGGSVQARYRELLGLPSHMPANGYIAEYLIEFAQAILDRDGDAHAGIPEDQSGYLHFARLAAPLVLAEIRDDLENIGVRFDVWFHEQSLFEHDQVMAEVRRLQSIGSAYEKEGAIWLKTQEHGDDEDRVLVRADGAPTYIASDLAYAADKIARGFEHLIFVLGPDHAGYVPRLYAAIAAQGFDTSRVEVIMYQTVRLMDGGEVLKMSKRKGSMVTLREITDDIGADATRFFFLMRSATAHFDFDLALAREHNEKNPVYYVQYAHTRICGIHRKAAEVGIAMPAEPDLSLLTHPAELALMRKIADYPGEVAEAAETRAPHRLGTFARELATTLHQFYGPCIVVDAAKPELSGARLALIEAARVVLANICGLLGISAPERM